MKHSTNSEHRLSRDGGLPGRTSKPCRQAAGLRRRTFLVTATAVATPWFIPGRALGAEGVPPSERIRVGLIGYGRQTHAYNFKLFAREKDAEVVAVCEVDRWRLEQGKQAVEAFYSAQSNKAAFRGCSVYHDYRDLLGRTDIDAVMISTPDHWHVPMTLDAFAAGKEVACEKPVNRSIAQGRAVMAAAKKYGRVYRVDSEFRSLENFHRVAELVRGGAIGKLKRIVTGVPASDDIECPPTPEMPVPEELDYDLWLGPAPKASYTENRVHAPKKFDRPGWMRILDYSDGIITNWGAHLNDIALWAADKERTGPVEIRGRGVWPAPGKLWNVLRTFEVHYRFADGLELIYKTDRPYARFEGEEGWIQADFPKKLEADPAGVLQATLPASAPRFPLKSEKRDFLDAVRSRGNTMEDAEVGHRVTSLCHLGHIAIHLGRELRWDPAAERFVDCPEADRYIDQPITALPQRG